MYPLCRMTKVREMQTFREFRSNKIRCENKYVNSKLYMGDVGDMMTGAVTYIVSEPRGLLLVLV